MKSSFNVRGFPWLAASAMLMAACSSPAPATDAGVQTDTGGQTDLGDRDVNTPADTAPVDAPVDAGGSDVGGGNDVGSTDVGNTDAGSSDVGSSDVGSTDVGTDAGNTDAGNTDAGVTDAGPADSGDPCGGPAHGRCILVQGIDDPPPTRCAEYPAVQATAAANLCNNRTIPAGFYLMGGCAAESVIGRCVAPSRFCERSLYYAGANLEAARSDCASSQGTWSEP